MNDSERSGLESWQIDQIICYRSLFSVEEIKEKSGESVVITLN